MADEQHEKWNAYPETILEFGTGGDRPPLQIDLRQPLDDSSRKRLAELGLQEPFAVFTAQNPEGENADDAGSRLEELAREVANARREASLEGALRAAGVPFRPVVGIAPDGDYREACVAAVMPRTAAVDLAKRLDQLALFWFDGTDFWLLPAALEAQPVRLPP